MSKKDSKSVILRGRIVENETDVQMIEKSMYELWNRVEDPTLLGWEDLRRLFTSHDLARCLVFYLQKEKFNAQNSAKQTIEVEYETV